MYTFSSKHSNGKRNNVTFARKRRSSGRRTNNNHRHYRQQNRQLKSWRTKGPKRTTDRKKTDEETGRSTRHCGRRPRPSSLEERASTRRRTQGKAQSKGGGYTVHFTVTRIARGNDTKEQAPLLTQTGPPFSAETLLHSRTHPTLQSLGAEYTISRTISRNNDNLFFIIVTFLFRKVNIPISYLDTVFTPLMPS